VLIYLAAVAFTYFDKKRDAKGHLNPDAFCVPIGDLVEARARARTKRIRDSIGRAKLPISEVPARSTGS